MFNKVYGVDFPYPTVFRRNGKLWNSHFCPKFLKSWIYQIAHIEYWIINDLTNDTSVMVWYTCKSKITVPYLQRRPSTFWKRVEKSGEIHTETRHVFVKHGCPRWQQSPNMAKSLSPKFWPCPTPGACGVSEVWATLRWTYSPSLVTVWPPKL